MENPFDQKIKYKFTNKINNLRPLSNHVLVREMNFSGRQLSSGIFLLGDDGTANGIRPRWAQVYAVGPEQKDIVVGQWILVEHGRWTRGVEVEIDGEAFTLRRVDPEAMLMVSDQEPSADDTISTAVDGGKRSRIDYANG